MEEKTLSEKESLRLISQMISTAKNTYYESGTGPLLWGFTNMICFLSAYLMETTSWFRLPFNPFALMGITFLIHIYFEKRELKYKTVRSHFEIINKYVWIAFAISMVILTIVGGFAQIGYHVFAPMLILFAIPTFISGCISKFVPLIAGGICCWVLAAFCFFVKGTDNYLLAAIAATCAWIVPGFILKYRFIQEKSKHGV